MMLIDSLLRLHMSCQCSSRSGKLPKHFSKSQALLSSGQHFLESQKCDVASSEEFRALRPHRRHHRVGLQFHAGGVLQDSILANQTAGGGRRVFAPKVGGLGKMRAELCAPTSCTVLFSSVAALLGSAGQANYCAANAVMDSSAQVEVAQGRCFASVQWGPWSGGGMATGLEARMQRLGLGMVDPRTGLAALQWVMRSGAGLCSSSAPVLPVVAVQPFHWENFFRSAGSVAPVFREIAASVPRAARPSAPPP